MSCRRSTLAVSIVLFVHSFALFEVGNSTASIGRQINVNWSPEGLEQIDNTIQVRVNDILVLECNNFSNVVTVNHQEFKSCNASGSSVALSRGLCYTVNATVDLLVQHSPAHLPSVINFTPGETLYFASFSRSRVAGDAYSPHYVGGECLQGLKLEVHVLNNTPTTTKSTTEAPTTETKSSESSKGEIIIPDEDLPVKLPDADSKESKKEDPKAEGLISGSRWLHSTPSLLCVLVLASYTLIR